MSPGTALPAWLVSILPQWFKDHAPFTEALYAGTYSMCLATVPILGALYGVALGDGAGDTLPHFLAWVGNHWFGLLMGYIFGGGVAGLRAKQANTKAAAVEPQNGTNL